LDVMNGSQPRSVQSSRWDGAIFLIIPGTSCLATIGLSLRDKKAKAVLVERREFGSGDLSNLIV
jgi:hypothetical protein